MRKIGFLLLATYFGILAFFTLAFIVWANLLPPEKSNISDITLIMRFLPILLGGIGILTFAIWIYSLIHALQNSILRDTERLLWVGLIVFLNILGAFLYFFIAPYSGNPSKAEQGAAANP